MKRWHMLLGTAFGPWVIALAYVLLVQGHTAAYNTYVNEYRKWPWRAGVEHYISTCPDQGQHQGQLWADDIDVAGSFPVHSASSRGIVAFNDWDSRGTGGWMLVIQEQDGLGYWVHYLHLAERAIFPTETQIVQGQRVATSGGTGGYEPHLHFGMSPCVYYDCASITIYPIAGFADSGSCTNAWYPSDNAGIGDMCGPPWPCEESTTLDGTYYSDFTEQYQDHGGYDWVGVTWDPYGYRVHWWVYPWSAGGYSGVAQNFIGGVIGQGAIMQGEGLDAFWVWGDFWYAYATGCAGTDNWAIYYIGYPTSERGKNDCPNGYGIEEAQQFENGAILTWCDNVPGHDSDVVEIYQTGGSTPLYAAGMPVDTPTPVPTRHWPTPTPIPTKTPTPTLTPTITPTPGPTNTPTITPTPTDTPAPTATPNIDTDGDGVLDHLDNCPSDSNPDQLNSDRRRPNGTRIPNEFASNPASGSWGDVCDPDDDNDVLPDILELDDDCPYRLNAHSDGDGSLDGYETVMLTDPCDSASKPGCLGLGSGDSDGDGIQNCLEVRGYGSNPIDSDGDACPDWLEIHDLDGNRKVDSGDSLWLAKRIAGLIPADPVSDPIFDVDKNGKIDSGDSLAMAKNTCSFKGYACPCSPE